MPLKVRRFCTSITFAVAAAAAVPAQTSQASASAVQTPPAAQVPAARPPTSADVMRDRISKAKAFIAVRNYNAAIYELENIRRETNDSSVNAVADVLLMNSYLEQGDYKRASDFLTELYNQQKTAKPNTGAYYAAVSAQIVKSARNQIDRYRTLGLTVSDRNLPLEAVNDIERMRETLELVVAQAKEMSADKAKSAAAMGMLEEATNTRSALARDDYDARRWRDEVSDSRENLANSRSVITNAVDGTTQQAAAAPAVTAANTQPVNVAPSLNQTPANAAGKTPALRPVNTESSTATAQNQETKTERPVTPNVAVVNTANAAAPQRNRVVPDVPKQDNVSAKTDAQPAPAIVEADASPLAVGSLIGYATKQTAAIYPAAAKSIRASGIVKVEVMINEAGEVAAVEKASGPPLLQTAAKDAIRKWKFRPFTRGGQPVRATGFVNFNFNL